MVSGMLHFDDPKRDAAFASRDWLFKVMTGYDQSLPSQLVLPCQTEKGNFVQVLLYTHSKSEISKYQCLVNLGMSYMYDC